MIKMYALLIGFALLQVSNSIALPGVYEYYGRVEDEFSDLPPEFSRHGELSSAIGTTQSPLEKLLDKLYGNGSWRSLLSEFTEPNIPTTYLPEIKATEAPHSANGFYGLEISGQAFNHQAKPSTAKTSTSKPPPAVHSGFSKTFNKIIGSQQHTVHVQANLRAEHPDALLNPLPMGSGAANIFLNEQARAQTQAVAAMPAPMETNGAQQSVKNSQQNGDSQQQMPTQPHTQNTEVAAQVFDPNVVNNQQHVYSPNEAFNGFITQTGSDPHIQGSYSNFNPDKVNQMNRSDNSLAGSVFQTPQGTSGGYRFNAYEDAERPSFDATSLNQALMTFNKPNLEPDAFFPNFRSNFVSGQRPAAQASHQSVTSAPDVETTPKKTASTKATVAPAAQRNPSGMFVPGSLFPGAGSDNNYYVDQQHGIGQIAGSPVFLRTMPMGNQAFNPNLLNAVQTNFNPNAQSWIRTRREALNNTADNPFTMTTTSLPTQATSATYLSTQVTNTQATTKTGNTLSTTVSVNTGTASESTTTVASTVPPSSQGGFDPNELNAHQGQSSFVPGRLTSGYTSGGSGNAYGQNHLQGGSNGGYNPNQSFGSNTSGYGGGSDGYDPNSMFSLVAKATDNGSASENGSSGSPFGIGLGTNSGFDPNAANSGFGSVGNGNYFGFTGNDSDLGTPNEFDPYGSSGGFNANTFGNAAAGSAGGDLYTSAFDPNKVNQMAMNNPYASGNDSDINQMMGNFLGGSYGGNAGSGSSQSGYGSAYIGVFNPDAVNQMTFDPDAFNNAHLHFDPLEMLVSNPGMDKATLMAVGAKFDPDKINSAHNQQSFSPIDMLGLNPGMDKNVLSNLKYDPATSGTMNNSNASGTASYTNGRQSVSFDPVDLMSRLMQAASAFYPGTSGSQHQNLDPSGIFIPAGGKTNSGGNGGSEGTNPSSSPATVFTSSVGKQVSKTPLMTSSTSASPMATSPTPAHQVLTSSTPASPVSTPPTTEPPVSTTT